MFLSSLVTALVSLCGRSPRAGAAQPSFDGLLEELFAAWPIEPWEEREGA